MIFKIKRLLFSISIFAFACNLNAQKAKVTPVKIGDNVPNFTVENIYNYTENKLHLNDLKGKLVILDFWGVNCGPCIGAFPHLDSLQNKFQDRIQIILVTPSSKGFIDSTFSYRRKVSPEYRELPSLPSITKDTFLKKLFPYELIPNDVWIGTDGKLRAITEGRYVTSENIEKMLLDDNFGLPVKNDFLSFDYQKAYLPQLFSSFPNRLEYYSAVMKYIPGLWGGTIRFAKDTIHHTVRISRANTLLYLFGDAISHSKAGNPYESSFFDYGKRVVIDTKDSSKFFFNGNKASGSAYEKWVASNTYIYETLLPFMNEDSAYAIYLHDLEHYFKIDASIQKKEYNCLSIELINEDSSKIRYHKVPDDIHATYFDSAGIYHLNGFTMETFKDALSMANKDSKLIFVNNTGYMGATTLNIHSKLSDLPALKKELEGKYHMTFVLKKEKLDALILSDKVKGDTP